MKASVTLTSSVPSRPMQSETLSMNKNNFIKFIL